MADAVKSFLGPKATTAGPPASGWPTWPPAELLVATGAGELFHDPSWETPLVLTPVTYHQHQLYLCVEEGLTVVLRQPSPGSWQYVRTLGELALLAAQPPLSGMQALLARSPQNKAPA